MSEERTVRRVTWIGLVANTGLATFKVVAGIYGHSQAVVADGVHSFTDTVSDLAVIIGSYFWSAPPDNNHPYGHRRIETFITIFIGIMLLAIGAGIAWEAVRDIDDMTRQSPGSVAIIAALVSIVSKEGLYRWTAAVGKRVRSTALMANALHHRSDAVSSFPVLVTVGGAYIFPTWSFLDLIGAFVVALLIARGGLKIVVPAMAELMDAGAPQDVHDVIVQAGRENKNVFDIHGIRSRFQSGAVFVDYHLVVPGKMSVRRAHSIGEDVKRKIMTRLPEIIDINYHLDPEEVMEKAVVRADKKGSEN